ncbi:MAG TPA: F0F1 ATP synthase subunit B [Candidatus Wunengus sp. YC63]|uniref:F0F1 ATP synthase subunit B n=1 Tax=unclassified Candidatus Wunengus TaxID=3367695 RepID=UPI0008D38EA3|nr:MAG: ATP synthase F0 subunit B [Planctomycetes bacterium GWB2_41_19]
MDILNTLGVNIKAVIIQAVGFLILLFVLKKYLFGKISAMIKERSEGIKSAYTKIDDDRLVAERLKGEYQKKISDAETEVARRIQEAVNEGSRVSEEIIKRAKEEIELMKVKAKEGIDQERKKALADIRNQVVTLSILASSRIIRQSISSQTAEKLVDDFIEEIGELRVR